MRHCGMNVSGTCENVLQGVNKHFDVNPLSAEYSVKTMLTLLVQNILWKLGQHDSFCLWLDT